MLIYLTGHFLFTRNLGIQYMLILYAYVTNTILTKPIKLRSDTDILREYAILYDTLKAAGYEPKMNIMDNNTSTSLKLLSQKMKTVLQLAPPHIHRRNAPKCAIRASTTWPIKLKMNRYHGTYSMPMLTQTQGRYFNTGI